MRPPSDVAPHPTQTGRSSTATSRRRVTGEGEARASSSRLAIASAAVGVEREAPGRREVARIKPGSPDADPERRPREGARMQRGERGCGRSAADAERRAVGDVDRWRQGRRRAVESHATRTRPETCSACPSREGGREGERGSGRFDENSRREVGRSLRDGRGPEDAAAADAAPDAHDEEEDEDGGGLDDEDGGDDAEDGEDAAGPGEDAMLSASAAGHALLGRRGEVVADGELVVRVVLPDGLDEDALEAGLGDGVVRDLEAGLVALEGLEGGSDAHGVARDLEAEEAAGGGGERGGVAEEAGDEGLDLGLSGGRGGDVELVVGAERVLEVLEGAEAAELALDHDGDAVAEGLDLLHEVRGEDDGAGLHGGAEDVPEVASGDGVEAGGGLVEEDESGVADDGDGGAELALHAAAEARGELVGVGAELELVEGGLDEPGRLPGRDAAELGEEPEMVGAGEEVPESVVLADDAEDLGGLLEVVEDGVGVDEDVARRGRDLAEDHVERGRLAGAVRAEEAEDLAARDAEGDVVDGDGVGGVGRLGGVDLAEVLDDEGEGGEAVVVVVVLGHGEDEVALLADVVVAARDGPDLVGGLVAREGLERAEVAAVGE
mmetsp:Transcript_20735/g.65201  ORF Transcript_20735/g.65201 Transcript_20735/m.65201 type:complete len:609 (-) Transcript_20735:3142-4968(-)